MHVYVFWLCQASDPRRAGLQDLVTHKQWSNYGGARGGLAHLKDLAPQKKEKRKEKKSALRRFKGPVNAPLEIAR